MPGVSASLGDAQRRCADAFAHGGVQWLATCQRHGQRAQKGVACCRGVHSLHDEAGVVAVACGIGGHGARSAQGHHHLGGTLGAQG